jgi:predicted transcriptional regulator
MININKVIERQVFRLHQDGLRKTEIGKIIGFSRSAVSNFFKRFDPWENIENKP